MTRIKYSIKSAMQHLSRNIGTGIGASLSMAVILFMVGCVAFLGVIVTNLTNDIEAQVTIQAFISDDVSTAEDTSPIDACKKEIKGWSEVDSVSFKSKDEAWAEYQESIKDNKGQVDAVNALGDRNPLPASLVVKTKEPEDVEKVAEKIMASDAFKAIADDKDDISSSVKYGQGTVEPLFAFSNVLNIGAIVAIVVFGVIGFVCINNTIRLAISARKREIAIERLVGASNGFIRGPFLAEGIIEALVGAVVAMIALTIVITAGLPALASNLQFLNIDIPVLTIVLTYLGITAGGVVVGSIVSMSAMRRYLKA